MTRARTQLERTALNLLRQAMALGWHSDDLMIDFATEAGRQIVSVRFHGMIREEAQAPAVAFDEVWHLVKNEGEAAWAIAGIQQSE